MSHYLRTQPPDAVRSAKGKLTVSRVLLLAILLAAMLMTATTVMAATITIDNVDGIFGQYVPANTACPRYSNQNASTTDQNQFRYGRPASDSACPANLDTDQSGYGFDGRNGSFSVVSETDFLLGDFVHFNRPITIPSGSTVLTSIPLTYNVRIGGVDYPFTFTANLDETPNSGTCPYPSDTPCSDRTLFTYVPTQQVIPITEGGVTNYYILQFSGFGAAGAGNVCPTTPGTLTNTFISQEGGERKACLYARFIFPTTSVQITKTGPASAVAGATIQYTLSPLQNTGPFALTNVRIVDTLPPNMKYVSATITNNTNSATCTDSPAGAYGAVVTCGGPGAYLPNIAANSSSSSTITLTVQVNPNDFANLPRTNTACLIGNVFFTIGGLTYISPSPSQACDDAITTTPVTVAYFATTKTDGGVRFDWTTATETGNGGFNLYARTADGVVKLNDEIILSSVIDSSAPTDYSLVLDEVPDGEYYIEDVAMNGLTRAHDAVGLNASFGERLQPEEIDWPAIQAENATLERQRLAAARESAAAMSPDAADAAAVYPTLDLRVNEDGIYRLTYEQIKAAGVDLAGVHKRNLAITNRGVPVHTYVSKPVFGPGAYIEFVGEALDTLYTDTNIYRLEVNRELARRVVMTRARPPLAGYATYYMETVTVENNQTYSYLTPNGDPWFDTFLNISAGTLTKYTDFTVGVNDYIGSAPSHITFDLWGISELVPGPDHHAQISVNGVPVADEWFDGNEIKVITAQLPQGVIAEGDNQLRLTVPVDSGAAFDSFAVESFGITYPRAFEAIDGRLDFEAKARAFHVTGLDSDQVVVYRLNNGRPARLNNVKVVAEGTGYSASFAGGKMDTYYVSTIDELLTPQIAVTPAMTDINSGMADLLIIAHPNFINADLDRLVQARVAQGYSVKVVDVNQVYAQYSGGVFDPQAIRDYIRHASYEMGVKYFLLVGGDTRDYLNYSGTGSISFIPSLYANTLDPVKMAPVDPLYTDYNNDNVPDRPIGRFPVRTQAELKLMVDKTLQYDARSNVQTAVFVADTGFEFDSDAFAAPLGGWTIDKAYVRSLGVAPARTMLINALNAGPRLASFVGHSGPTNWKSNSLFSANDAAALTNVNAPTLVTQWGCWNTYYVDPRYDTLGHKFLLSGMNGAALVTGSSTLTNSDSERALGELMMAQLMQPGTTVGEAMWRAKVELAREHPDMNDVLLGWTILGDPTVEFRP